MGNFLGIDGRQIVIAERGTSAILIPSAGQDPEIAGGIPKAQIQAPTLFDRPGLAYNVQDRASARAKIENMLNLKTFA